MSASVGPKLACIRKRAASSAVREPSGGAGGSAAGAGVPPPDDEPLPHADTPKATAQASRAARAVFFSPRIVLSCFYAVAANLTAESVAHPSTFTNRNAV